MLITVHLAIWAFPDVRESASKRTLAKLYSVVRVRTRSQSRDAQTWFQGRSIPRTSCRHWPHVHVTASHPGGRCTTAQALAARGALELWRRYYPGAYETALKRTRCATVSRLVSCTFGSRMVGTGARTGARFAYRPSSSTRARRRTSSFAAAALTCEPSPSKCSSRGSTRRAFAHPAAGSACQARIARQVRVERGPNVRLHGNDVSERLRGAGRCVSQVQAEARLGGAPSPLSTSRAVGSRSGGPMQCQGLSSGENLCSCTGGAVLRGQGARTSRGAARPLRRVVPGRWTEGPLNGPFERSDECINGRRVVIGMIVELEARKSSHNAAPVRVMNQPAERPDAQLFSWWRMGRWIANILRCRFPPKRQSRAARGEVSQLLNLCRFRGTRSCAYGIVDRMLERDYRCTLRYFATESRNNLACLLDEMQAEGMTCAAWRLRELRPFASR